MVCSGWRAPWRPQTNNRWFPTAITVSLSPYGSGHTQPFPYIAIEILVSFSKQISAECNCKVGTVDLSIHFTINGKYCKWTSKIPKHLCHCLLRQLYIICYMNEGCTFNQILIVITIIAPNNHKKKTKGTRIFFPKQARGPWLLLLVVPWMKQRLHMKGNSWWKGKVKKNDPCTQRASISSMKLSCIWSYYKINPKIVIWWQLRTVINIINTPT